MEHLFFNYDRKLSETVAFIFSALGFTSIQEGDSLNVFGGTYASVSILGIVLKLEENSYDYEDDYRYMLSVKNDASSPVTVSDGTIRTFAGVVARILADNAALEVAVEVEAGIEVIGPTVGR